MPADFRPDLFCDSPTSSRCGELDVDHPQFPFITLLHLNRGFARNDRYLLLLGVVRVHLKNLQM